jgi:hypothetical protein
MEARRLNLKSRKPGRGHICVPERLLRSGTAIFEVQKYPIVAKTLISRPLGCIGRFSEVGLGGSACWLGLFGVT